MTLPLLNPIDMKSPRFSESGTLYVQLMYKFVQRNRQPNPTNMKRQTDRTAFVVLFFLSLCCLEWLAVTVNIQFFQILLIITPLSKFFLPERLRCKASQPRGRRGAAPPFSLPPCGGVVAADRRRRGRSTAQVEYFLLLSCQPPNWQKILLSPKTMES